MIYEYALDPALVATWHDRRKYLFFEEKFGIATRRFVSIYPKKTKWQRMIWEAFESSEYAEDQNAKLNLSALIGKLTEDAVKRRSTFSEIPSWIERTEKEHSIRPFWAILTSVPGRNHLDVIEARCLIENGHDKWTVPGLPTVRRRAAEVADLIAPVLRACRHAIFVDPYFDPCEPRFLRPFKAMIEKMYEYRDDPGEVSVELHISIEGFFKSAYSAPRTEENEKLKCVELTASFKEKLCGIIPAGGRIKFVVWKERDYGQQLHNRYILTDFFGIQFGAGLDEASGRDSETEDDVTCLSREQLSVRWKQYGNTNPAFDYAGEPVEILGQKTFN